MQNSNRKYWYRLMHNPFVAIVALVLLFFLARSAWNMHRSADSVSTKLAQRSSELEKLREDQANLSAKIDSLSTQTGIESELRTKYRAVKAGESVAVIVGEDQTASSGLATSTETKGWFDGVLGWFGL